MKKLKLVSRDMIPLLPGKKYVLEDIYQLSKFILIKMLELLGESAWGVMNVVSAIRSRVESDYYTFYLKYSKLTAEQRKILELLTKKPGQAVFAKEIAQTVKFSTSVNIEKEIQSLVSTAWIIGGAHSGEMVILITEEISELIGIAPQYLAYFEVEKPADMPVAESKLNLFDDLSQLTSQILVEPPKITNNGLIGKNSLKKIMPRLSSQVSSNWEEHLKNNYYSFSFSILLEICEYMDCVEVVPTEPSGQIQVLKVEKYIKYLEITAPQRLGIALTLFFIHLKDLNSYEFCEVAKDILCFGKDAKGRFLTPLKLAQICSKNIKYDIARYGEAYDRYFSTIVLEPLLYLGLVEKISIHMPAPWRSDKKDSLSERNLWRLSRLGLAFGDILSKSEKKYTQDKKLSRGKNPLFENDHLVRFLNSELFNDKLFLAEFGALFPPAAQKELVIQNDMTFFVPQNAPPLLIWLLNVFGESAGATNNYIFNGRFTKESVIKALKSGLLMDGLITLMKQECKTELPKTVERVLKDWSLSYNRAIFAKVTVVVCDTPELAAELSANAKFSEIILGRLGPQTVFIRDNAEKTVRQWLEKKGRVPLPGVYGSEPLAKWVSEHGETPS